MNQLRLLLVAPLFCVPFLAMVHAEPLVSFHHEWLAAACGLLVVFAFLIGQRAGATSLPAAAAFPVLLIVLLLSQMAMDMIVYPSQGRAAILCLMLAAGVMVATRNIMLQVGIGKLAGTIAWALLAGGVLQGIAAVLQYWEIHSLLDPVIAAKARQTAFGNLAQANHFATYQTLALAALLFLTTTRRLSLWLCMAIGVFLLLSLALSGSRSSWLYLLSFAALAYAFDLRQSGRHSRQLILLTLSALATYFILQTLLGLIQEVPTTATSRILESPHGLLDTRLSLWSSALAMFADSPLMGVGYQNYSWQFFLGSATSPTPPTNAHNLVLHMLAEFGLGGGVFALLLGYWLLRALARLATVEQWLAVSSVTILLIHSMLEFPLHYLHFMLPGAVLFALLNEDSGALAVSDKLMKPLTLLVWASGTAMLFMSFSNYTLLSRSYADFSADRVQLDPTQIKRLLQIQGSILFEPEAENLLNSLRITNTNLDLLPSLLAVSARQARQKAGASRIFRHILLLGLDNDLAEAKQLLTQAAQAHPEQLEEFKKKLDELRMEFPTHPGLQALESQFMALRNTRAQ